jgi:hypothetical protein
MHRDAALQRQAAVAFASEGARWSTLMRRRPKSSALASLVQDRNTGASALRRSCSSTQVQAMLCGRLHSSLDRLWQRRARDSPSSRCSSFKCSSNSTSSSSNTSCHSHSHSHNHSHSHSHSHSHRHGHRDTGDMGQAHMHAGWSGAQHGGRGRPTPPRSLQRRPPRYHTSWPRQCHCQPCRHQPGRRQPCRQLCRRQQDRRQHQQARRRQDCRQQDPSRRRLSRRQTPRRQTSRHQQDRREQDRRQPNCRQPHHRQQRRRGQPQTHGRPEGGPGAPAPPARR